MLKRKQPTHFKKRLNPPMREEMFKSFITIKKKSNYITLSTFTNPPMYLSVCPETIPNLIHVEPIINIYPSFIRDKNEP